MIDPTEAESALEWLTKNARMHAELVGQLRRAEDGIKKIEALLIKGMDNAGVPVSIRQAHARADDKYQDALDLATTCKIDLVEHEDLRDCARHRIMLYMSQVKDRM